MLNDKGNQRQKSFGHLGNFFLVANHRICIIRTILLFYYPSLMKTLQSNENASLTSSHTSHICCAVEPLLMFGISSNDFAISPEHLSTCLAKTGKKFIIFITASIMSVSQQQLLRSLIICFATAPVSICVFFVRPHRYLFTILESGNMFLNSLAPWSTVLKGWLCSTRKPKKKQVSFHYFLVQVCSHWACTKIG